jgi:hypothetical protein
MQTSSAQPHIHRLEPLHPADLAFLAMQNGVPVAPSPVGPARGAATAGDARSARGGRPGGAIEPEVLADPHRALVSAMQAACILFVGAKLLLPEQDTGLDFEKEFETAKAMASLNPNR